MSSEKQLLGSKPQPRRERDGRLYNLPPPTSHQTSHRRQICQSSSRNISGHKIVQDEKKIFIQVQEIIAKGKWIQGIECFDSEKDGGTKSYEFSEKFQRGRGFFSIQKFMLQILDTLNRAFWAWNQYKRVISMFSQQFYWEKSKQDTLWRIWIFFRKFIQFGSAILPSVKSHNSHNEQWRRDWQSKTMIGLGSDKNRFPIATIRKTTKILAGDLRFLVFVLLSQNVEAAKICHKNKIT